MIKYLVITDYLNWRTELKGLTLLVTTEVLLSTLTDYFVTNYIQH